MAKHGLLSAEAAAPKSISSTEVDSMASIPGWNAPLGRYLFASNSRTVPDRAQKCFGYKGEHPSLLTSMEADILAALDAAA